MTKRQKTATVTTLPLPIGYRLKMPYDEPYAVGDKTLDNGRWRSLSPTEVNTTSLVARLDLPPGYGPANDTDELNTADFVVMCKHSHKWRTRIEPFEMRDEYGRVRDVASWKKHYGNLPVGKKIPDYTAAEKEDWEIPLTSRRLQPNDTLRDGDRYLSHDRQWVKVGLGQHGEKLTANTKVVYIRPLGEVPRAWLIDQSSNHEKPTGAISAPFKDAHQADVIIREMFRRAGQHPIGTVYLLPDWLPIMAYDPPLPPKQT